MSSGTAFGTLGDPPGPLKTYVFLKEFNDFHHCGNPDFSSGSASHPRRPRGPRVPREAGFWPPAPLPLVYFTRLFSEYTILLQPSFLIAPHAGPRGRRIREACGHMRRPWKRDGPSTFPARRNASSPKNCERTSRVRMCARLPRVFGLSHFLGPIQIFQSENLFASLFNPKTSLPGQLGRRRTDFRPKMVSRMTPKALPELPRCAPWSSAGGSVSRWESRLDQDTST